MRQEGILFKWLGEIPEEVPFVGFAGAFTAMLETPFAVTDHVLHCWKENGLIYCKKGMAHPPPPHPSTPRPASSSGGRTNEEFKKNTSQHMRMNFTRHLLSPQNSSQVLSEDEKFFKISKVNLSSHTIITMSEVNAVNVRGEEVKVVIANWNPKHQRERFFASRFLEIWSHAQLVDQKTIVIGSTEPYSHNLSQVRIMPAASEDLVETMERGLGNGIRDPTYDRAQWSPRLATNFMNRFLTYVKQILEPQTDGRVLTFRYNRMRSHDLHPVIESHEASENIRCDRLYLRI